MNDKQLLTERLGELLADRALFGLTDDEQLQLNALMAEAQPGVDLEAFDRAAAVASLSILDGTTGPLPDQLRQRIVSSYSGMTTRPGESDPKVLPAGASEISTESTELRPARSGLNRREWLAWTAAAAATTFLVVDRVGWMSAWKSSPSLANARDELLRSAPDTVGSVFKITTDPSARDAVGDVVWSKQAQQGFVRLRGLPVNEPYIHQYQAWIFDAKQDDRYPIDAGTFDVTSKLEECVIPLRPRLPVVDLLMIAVTLEKRGGVVVSKRDRTMLVAEFKVKNA